MEKNKKIPNKEKTQEYKSLSFISCRVATIVLGSFIFGYSWTIYNQLFHVVKTVYNWPEKYENWISGGINSLFMLTAIFGCLFLSTLKKFRRLKILQIFDLLTILGSTCLLIVDNYALVAGRALQGLVAGGNSVLVPLFIKEFVPLELYPKTSILISLGMILGQVTSLLVGAPIDNIGYKDYWRICLLPCAILPIFRVFILRRWKYETPAYYIMNHDDDNARKALREIYFEEYVEKRLKAEKRTLIGASGADENTAKGTIDYSEEESKTKTVTLTSLLKTPPNLKVVIIGILMFFNQQFGGINAVNFYSTKVFKSLGSDSFATYMSAIWGLINIGSVVISLFFIVENFKRKTLWIYGSLATSITLFFIGYVSNSDQSTIALFGFFVYTFVFNFSLGPLPWTLIAEMTHNKLINLPITSHWIFALLIAQFFPVMIEDGFLGLDGTFYAFGVLTLVFGILLGVLMKETKGKTKYEILELYKGNKVKGNEDEEVVKLVGN